MNAFLGGIVFGAILAGSIFVIFITITRRPRRDPVEWTPEFHDPQPPVTSMVLFVKLAGITMTTRRCRYVSSATLLEQRVLVSLHQARVW